MHTVVVYLLTIVEVLSSLLLIGVILLQKSKQQGIGLAFGAAAGESLFGAQAGNVLTRATVVLAIVFLVNTALLAMLGSGQGGGSSITDTLPAGSPPAGPPPSEMPNGTPPGRAMPMPDMDTVPAPTMPDVDTAPAPAMPEAGTAPAPAMPDDTAVPAPAPAE